MSLRAKLILAALLVGGLVWGFLRLWDVAGDARESAVRLEWAQEREALIAARQAAEQEAAKRRKAAEETKQENTERGENVIIETRYIDRNWSDTKLPPGLFDTLRKN